MPMEEERYTVARMFRSYLATTARLGLREEISRSCPELKQLFDKPPLVTARIPGSTCDKLYDAVYKARGRAAIRSFGHEAMIAEGHPLMGSLVDSTIRLYGRTPAAMFKNLSVLMTPIVGNIEVAWSETGPREGVVELRPQGQPTTFAYAVWEGYLEYFLESVGTSGTVAEAVLAPDHHSATIAVRW